MPRHSKDILLLKYSLFLAFYYMILSLVNLDLSLMEIDILIDAPIFEILQTYCVTTTSTFLLLFDIERK